MVKRYAEPDQEQIAWNRFKEILGEHEFAIRLAKLFGRDKTAIHRWYRTGLPKFVFVTLELLEVAPQWKVTEIKERIDDEMKKSAK
jgi:hypothetical protein